MALTEKAEEFRDWIANSPNKLNDIAKNNSEFYRGLAERPKEEFTGGIDPTQTDMGKIKMRYGTRILNYANVPRAELLAKGGVLLTSGLVDEKQLAQNARASLEVITAVPTEYMWSVVGELNSRYEEILRLVAQIDTVVASFGQGIYPAAEGAVEQAKTDMALLSYNLTLIMQLVEKVSQALPAAKSGSSNIQKIFDAIFQAIDLLEEMLAFIEDVTNEMTQEEYDRVMALYNELIKNKDTVNSPVQGTIFKTIINGLMSLLLPYITNLVLALTMECFNAIMKIIKKIPGVGDILVPPLDMIPSIASLVGLLLNGNLYAVLKRFDDDVETIYGFMRATQKIAQSSPEKLSAAEAAVAENSRKETEAASTTAAASDLLVITSAAADKSKSATQTTTILEEEAAADKAADDAINNANLIAADLISQTTTGSFNIETVYS